MDGNGEKKKIRQYLSIWSFPVVVLVVVFLVLIFLAGWFLCLESNRNYGQLATSLITAAGVVLTLSMTQARAIEELRAEGQRDRAQRSITQRIDLAEKLVKSIDHLSSENELRQAAGVQEILFQIDDWYVLIESEIAGIEGDKAKKYVLEQEGLRRRQELFDIAYKFDTKNVMLLKSRARGLRQRLMGDDDHSLIGLDFSGIVIGLDGIGLDLRYIKIGELVMTDCEMRMVDLRYASLDNALLLRSDFYRANLEYAGLKNAKLLKVNFECAILKKVNLNSADLEGAVLKGADLSGATLVSACLKSVNMESAIVDGANFADAMYNRATVFPKGFRPDEHGMQLVDETGDES